MLLDRGLIRTPISSTIGWEAVFAGGAGVAGEEISCGLSPVFVGLMYDTKVVEDPAGVLGRADGGTTPTSLFEEDSRALASEGVPGCEMEGSDGMGLGDLLVASGRKGVGTGDEVPGEDCPASNVRDLRI